MGLVLFKPVLEQCARFGIPVNGMLFIRKIIGYDMYISQIGFPYHIGHEYCNFFIISYKIWLDNG